METALSLVRGFRAAIACKVDIVNMSYGEPSGLPNSGRVIEVANEMVWKHGITFVASAGAWGVRTAARPGTRVL